MKKLLKLIVISLVVNFFAKQNFSIVIRHDRDDVKYLALGAKYPQSGFFQERVGCTLIAPNWAITAAHTVENSPPFTNYFVMFGGKRYEVEKIITHPARIKDTVDSSADIALLKLKEPVKDIAPALLYDKQDEAGKPIVLVGYGKTGTGLTGETSEKGKRRGATNEIDGTLENSLILTFDAPPFGTDLEGIGGSGDSGSPAFHEENGKLYLIGINSFNSGNSKAATVGKYLTFDGYARVSTRRKWILENIKNDPPNSLWSELQKIQNNTFPKTVFGNRAAAFFKAFNSGKETAMAEFYASHRPPSPEGKTPQERAKGWQGDMDNLGKYKVYGYSKQGNQFAFLVFAAKKKIWQGVLLEFEKTKPYRITGISIWDSEPPKDLVKP
ncbi:MAG: trypsin-like serine protease [Pyrinomonadaceae bacterium]|nr:trypsin-like serine protease [Pyrinomonadaceae bacterium]